jgi:hypothetical protein
MSIRQLVSFSAPLSAVVNRLRSTNCEASELIFHAKGGGEEKLAVATDEMMEKNG